eukprot:gnl/Spiro4/12903_TR6835_c0_g1_i2.p1 gnl/Spiro4/12903_TR6835_c0_g1~~gnl/Spiro4/12903_TR6835_c0_g1_i2.p1  ORF type:complete len:492 (-),score=92.72 gnl/Spiro4/12903_TR6835_c0_g1_i2:71-1498(-)
MTASPHILFLAMCFYFVGVAHCGAVSSAAHSPRRSYHSRRSDIIIEEPKKVLPPPPQRCSGGYILLSDWDDTVIADGPLGSMGADKTIAKVCDASSSATFCKAYPGWSAFVAALTTRIVRPETNSIRDFIPEPEKVDEDEEEEMEEEDELEVLLPKVDAPSINLLTARYAPNSDPVGLKGRALKKMFKNKAAGWSMEYTPLESELQQQYQAYMNLLEVEEFDQSRPILNLDSSGPFFKPDSDTMKAYINGGATTKLFNSGALFRRFAKLKIKNACTWYRDKHCSFDFFDKCVVFIGDNGQGDEAVAYMLGGWGTDKSWRKLFGAKKGMDMKELCQPLIKRMGFTAIHNVLERAGDEVAALRQRKVDVLKRISFPVRLVTGGREGVVAVAPVFLYFNNYAHLASRLRNIGVFNECQLKLVYDEFLGHEISQGCLSGSPAACGPIVKDESRRECCQYLQPQLQEIAEGGTPKCTPIK